MTKNKLTDNQKHSIIVRTITAVVLVALIAPTLIFGSIYFVLVSIILSIGFAYESVHITDLKGRARIFAFVIMIILLLATCYYVYIRNYIEASNNPERMNFLENLFPDDFFRLQISPMLLLTSAAVLFVFSVISKQFTIRYVFYFLSMIIILSLGIQSLLYLRYTPFYKFAEEGITTSEDWFQYGQSLGLIFYVVLGVCINDIGAFFVGLNFGHHKMAPEISPKKTWEGAIGGIILSFAVTFTFAMVLAACNYPILPEFDLKHWYWILFISILIPFFGDIGDFFFSSIKRSFGVKDFSAILPGHGGILDRLDSLIFASGLVSGLIVLMNFIAEL